MSQDIISDAEKIRIAAIDDVKARQQSSEEYRISLRIHEDPRVARNYEVFNTQCSIDEMLNKLVLFIKRYKEGANESYMITSRSPFSELIEEQDFIDYSMNNIIPTIDNEVIDKDDKERIESKNYERLEIAKKFYSYNMEEMRNFLYLCHSLKPNPMPKFQSDGSIDALECFAAGVNPEAFYISADNWFMERRDYSPQYIKEAIIDGTINGRAMATKTDPEKRSKKY